MKWDSDDYTSGALHQFIGQQLSPIFGPILSLVATLPVKIHAVISRTPKQSVISLFTNHSLSRPPMRNEIGILDAEEVKYAWVKWSTESF
jgi:hypothetical protein